MTRVIYEYRSIIDGQLRLAELPEFDFRVHRDCFSQLRQPQFYTTSKYWNRDINLVPDCNATDFLNEVVIEIKSNVMYFVIISLMTISAL